MAEREEKPGRIDVSTLSVLDVLELCERDFVFYGGCTMTDRPDLPLSPETSWKSDCSMVLAAINHAKRQLCGAEVSHAASGSGNCDSLQPKEGA